MLFTPPSPSDVLPATLVGACARIEAAILWQRRHGQVTWAWQAPRLDGRGQALIAAALAAVGWAAEWRNAGTMVALRQAQPQPAPGSLVFAFSPPQGPPPHVISYETTAEIIQGAIMAHGATGLVVVDFAPLYLGLDLRCRLQGDLGRSDGPYGHWVLGWSERRDGSLLRLYSSREARRHA